MARGQRTRQDFVDAASALVAESGWGSLSATSLSERVGAHPTAMYRHFANWNDVVVAVFDARIGDTVAATSKNVKGSPRDHVLGLMRAFRSAAEADPYMADCLIAILRSESTVTAPNFDSFSRSFSGLLEMMGVPPEHLPTLYQALETLTMGSIISDFTGHPHHITHRLHRRRLSGIAAFEPSSRSEQATHAVSNAAFELTANLLLDECERVAVKANAGQESPSH